MAPPLSWLSACKSSQLKALATATGLNSSGTKPLLTSQLLAHLPISNFANNGSPKASVASSKAMAKAIHYDIISIDMGIRNLAYCRLTSPYLSSSPPFPSFYTPTLSDWRRVEISKSPKKEADVAKAKEPFDPLTYSAHAYQLITTLLSTSPTSSPPTHILIERQRFRSMGGSAVQEWTLRVNMFEAMLYAVLRTLKEKGLWEGKVCPVAPSKVAKFWLGDGLGSSDGSGSSSSGNDSDGVGRKRGGKSAKTKMAKVGVVRQWLETKDVVSLEGKGKEMGRAYLGKKSGRGTKKSKDEDADIGKVDDLADCLLQGMAWIKWEQNRSLIMEKGVGALDEIELGEMNRQFTCIMRLSVPDYQPAIVISDTSR